MADEQVFHERRTITKGDRGLQRGDYSGAAVTSEGGLGKYGEAALKGHLFSGVATTQTIAAGNLNAAAAAATTNTGLLNPVNSSVAIVLQRVSVAIQSGTPTAGSIYHSVSLDTTIATSITGFSQGKACNNVASQTAAGYVLDSDAGVTLTGSSALVTVGCFGVGLSAAAVTTGLLIGPVVAEVDGSIVLGPGDMYLPTFTGAGTTVIANFGYLWTEVPLVAL